VPDDARIEVIRTHFDGYANTWHDRLNQHPYAIRRRVIDSMIKKCPQDRVADIGCGTGDYSTLFDHEHTEYTGYDLSQEMVDQCRALYPAYRFEVAQAERIPSPDASFNLALSVAVLEYYEDPAAQLIELARVLEPGGVAVVCMQNKSNISKPVLAALDRWVLRPLGRLRPTAKKTQQRQNANPPKTFSHRMFSANEIKRLAEPHGLELEEYGYASVRLLPTTFSWLRKVDILLSDFLSGRASFKWITVFSATILICNFRKKTTSLRKNSWPKNIDGTRKDVS
jgi:ubiquinone/menaquinone biosynthesis C-methylase UbiE